MISFLIALVITAFVVEMWFEDLRQTDTVPVVGTGSPQTLTYLVNEGEVGFMLCAAARSAAIKVAALPVSGNVGKSKDPSRMRDVKC